MTANMVSKWYRDHFKKGIYSLAWVWYSAEKGQLTVWGKAPEETVVSWSKQITLEYPEKIIIGPLSHHDLSKTEGTL